MSRVLRLLSQTLPGKPPWHLPWEIEEFSGAPPPADQNSALMGLNGPPYFPVGGGPEDIFSNWFGRVPAWEARPTDGPVGPADRAIPELTIHPGSSAILPAFNLGIEGASGWTPIGVIAPPVIVTGLVATKNGEFRLPFDRKDGPPEDDECNFEYSREAAYTYDAAFPAGSISVSFTFELKVWWNEAVNYGGVAYVPYRMNYFWDYTDDGGNASGGFSTEYFFLGGGTFGSGDMVAQFRLAERTFGGVNHMVPLAIQAQEVKRNAVGFVGETTTSAGVTALEVGGRSQNSNVWVQPVTGAETYFGYRSDNSDDSTCLYDPVGGHLLVPEEDFPYSMVPLA